MDGKNKIYCSNRSNWRKWLTENADKQKEVWLIYFKKHTGKPRVSYDDAVEEAICFGWIDSIVKRLDNERFMQRFTPRNMGSNWSEHNVIRANKMLNEGKMTEKGLSLFNHWKSSNTEPLSRGSTQEKQIPPDDLLEALMMNDLALSNFNNLAPSYKRNYILWINDAKKEDTRSRRIEKVVKMLEKNTKSFM